jgi:3-phosphoshikimate 1-carboxyvinyltransferase
MNQNQKNNKPDGRVMAMQSQGLFGEINIPGDKSISHRCVILSSLAVGESKITGILNSSDISCTINAMRSLGSDIHLQPDMCTINGIGIGSLAEPEKPLDFGNSGTAARLIMGLVTSHPISSVFIGDESLSKRPMRRVVDPLLGNLPIPISYDMPIPSAQVKSAILFAGLNTPGVTSIFEKQKTRDHTEKLLDFYGYNVDIKESAEGTKISIVGQQELRPVNINIPGDPSSAAYPAIAGLVCKNSNVTIKNVLDNPTRDGLYKSLIEMGANIEFLNERSNAGEKVHDILVKSSSLKAIEICAKRAPSMIDDYPALAVAASVAEGISIFRGLSELRVKESDRLVGIKYFLEINGVEASISNDDLIIKGNPSGIKGGGLVKTSLDHRIAMSSLILGLVSDNPVYIDDSETINTSFPGFIDLMNKLGARLEILELDSDS